MKLLEALNKLLGYEFSALMEIITSQASSILTYIKQNLSDNHKLIKGLKEVKLRIVQNAENSKVFRKLGLAGILIELLQYEDEKVLSWSLSILATCLFERTYLEEIHKKSGTNYLHNIFKTTKSEAVKLKACRAIGQQCVFGPSCSTFHTLNTVKLIVSFIKNSASDEEKLNAIKTLRYLGNTAEHQYSILQEKGLYVVCSVGLSSPSDKLYEESFKMVHYFSKRPTAEYFHQIIKGTDNLQAFARLYERTEEKLKTQVFDILLLIFTHHSSYSNLQEYNKNSQILDFLSMAKLPSMIVSKIRSGGEFQKDYDESKLVISLCKFCELNKNWRKFSCNVLPTYHERTWMQMTDCEGITVLISLLSSKRENLIMLQALFRGLLGIEYLHSSREKVLRYCIEAKLLPLLTDILDDALNHTCNDDSVDQKSQSCHHLATVIETREVSFNKEAPKEFLELIATTPPKPSCSNLHQAKQASRQASEFTAKAFSTTCYKQINKIKFRTGKRSRDRSKTLSYSSDNENNAVKKSRQLDLFEEDQRQASERTESPNSQKKFAKHFYIWMNIGEYIIRLLHQVISIKKDMTSICKQFLSRFYLYLANSCIVHPTAIKLLSTFAKNTSNIQYMLDIQFIPKLAVDLLQKVAQQEACPQCMLLKDGVLAFLDKLGCFFNHCHQYGQCEVGNRLNPSKPDIVKHSCLVAITHVVKCPKLLHCFLLDHRGLEALLLLLHSAQHAETKLHLYSIASVCSISVNLKLQFYNKHRQCLFCYSHHLAVITDISLEKKERKKQLLYLTLPRSDLCEADQKCVLNDDLEKDFSFQFDDKLVTSNRETLSKANEVFRLMLQGSFSESKEDCIRIKDVNSLGMDMVIHFLHGCTCSVFHCEDASVYTELIYLSQLYFVPELQILAIHKLSSLLSPDNIYSFVESGVGNILEEETLEHFFCSIIAHSGPVQRKELLFREIMSTPLKDIFLKCVSKGLTRLLTVTSTLCICDKYLRQMPV